LCESCNCLNSEFWFRRLPCSETNGALLKFKLVISKNMAGN